mmetsp:Transcript_5469/g.16178  ORF Transcript_5469/g.16178 Transcript_5469/m.16178 type:complete len:725 (-) Transcript_5469:47-2221(-)|eukprot:CAMPEP_0119551134 /NCGR_PEP_ID=MMETSP1352-20130426/4476_1 /TAXON_ID=265584 /ORGANISM="Stauroneis constricta, Strain CCMP1120" /LENGTH=724 /DNA_ID=CAMNT_0007597143 /DNA_START=761 /DNA_END=2935 /DNA_ORIENTATION=+
MAPSAPDAEQVWEDRQPNMPLNTSAMSAHSTATMPAWSVQSDSAAAKTNSACCGIDQTGASRDALVSPWVDWVEGGIEFFGCDGDRTSKSILGRTLTLSHRVAGASAPQSPRAPASPVDYSKMHDDFIESLFQEQWAERIDSNTSSSVLMRDTDDDSSSVPLNRIDSCGTEPSQSRSLGSWTDTSSVSSEPNTSALASNPTHHKRRRPLKFKKAALNASSTAAGKNKPKVSSAIDSYQQMYGPKSSSVTSPKSVLPPNGTPPRPPRPASSSHNNAAASSPINEIAEQMVHSECKIQKDKGKGEPIGTSISADGRHNCLSKLRDKIRLLVQVALDGPASSGSTVSSASSSGSSSRRASKKKSVGSAGMKRRPAKISEETPLYTETRSMIELRLGFVSMQYGLLLRWDRADKIIFIVLRKMCHDSFYKKIKEPVRSSQMLQSQQQHPAKKTVEPPPLVVRNVVGEQAIYQRVHGTEVVLVDTPYRVAQPKAFEPSILSVQINHVTGLPKKQRWTISLTFDGHTEVSELVWKQGQFVTRRVETMEWEISPVTSFDLAGLEIRLFEQLPIPKRRRRRNPLAVVSGKKQRKTAELEDAKELKKDDAGRWFSSSRVYSDLTMPLGGLVAQPSTAQATTWELTIPANDEVSITMSLVHQSDYAHWLYKELDARRKEETPSHPPIWRTPFRRNQVRDIHADDEYDEEDLWDWLCGFCGGNDASSNNQKQLVA